MCGEALKREIAFQEEDAHETHTGYIAGNIALPNPETGGAAGAVCPAAWAGLHPAPDIDL